MRTVRLILHPSQVGVNRLDTGFKTGIVSAIIDTARNKVLVPLSETCLGTRCEWEYFTVGDQDTKEYVSNHEELVKLVGEGEKLIPFDSDFAKNFLYTGVLSDEEKV